MTYALILSMAPDCHLKTGNYRFEETANFNYLESKITAGTDIMRSKKMKKELQLQSRSLEKCVLHEQNPFLKAEDILFKILPLVGSELR